MSLPSLSKFHLKAYLIDIIIFCRMPIQQSYHSIQIFKRKTRCRDHYTKVRNIWFLSPLVPSKQEKSICISFAQFVYLLREAFTIQFLSDKIKK